MHAEHVRHAPRLVVWAISSTVEMEGFVSRTSPAPGLADLLEGYGEFRLFLDRPCSRTPASITNVRRPLCIEVLVVGVKNSAMRWPCPRGLLETALPSRSEYSSSIVSPWPFLRAPPSWSDYG